MTRLGIITQFLSKMANQPESELLAWAKKNIEPTVMLKLNEEVSPEEVSELIAELDKSPEAFLSKLLGQLSRQRPHRMSAQPVNPGLAEATSL
jgi:hypothetical protein